MAPDRLRILHVSPQPVETAQRYAQQGFDVSPNLIARFREAFDQLEMITVFAQQYLPKASELEAFDGVVLTGSIYSVFDAPDWQERLEALTRECIATQKAFLGICYGHQTVAQACGGAVEQGTEGPEIGVVPIVLTPYGRNDPLFEGIEQVEPKRGIDFRATSIHSDIVTKPPYMPDMFAQELARSQLYGNQAFALGGRGRSVQFHPEIRWRDLEVLIRLEPSVFAMPMPEQSICDGADAAGDTTLRNYITNFVLGKGSA